MIAADGAILFHSPGVPSGAMTSEYTVAELWFPPQTTRFRCGSRMAATVSSDSGHCRSSIAQPVSLTCVGRMRYVRPFVPRLKIVSSPLLSSADSELAVRAYRLMRINIVQEGGLNLQACHGFPH